MREYPEDKKIIDTYLKTVETYSDKSVNWHLRITADELSCPIAYVRGVLEEASDRGEI